MPQAEPFDRAARRRARDRAWPPAVESAFIHEHVAGELAERIAFGGEVPDGPELRIGLFDVPHPGAIALDPGFRAARARQGIQADEDRLPIADDSLSRITAFMTLHGVNDLPGALILARRALKKGGRLFAAFPGGFSLAALREAFLTADAASGRGVAPRLGPSVDPSEAAGLLQRAGFVEPVVDVDTLTVRYSSLQRLARDVRAVGDSGWLQARRRGLQTPGAWAAAEQAFAALADDGGKVPVEVQIIYMAARAP